MSSRSNELMVRNEIAQLSVLMSVALDSGISLVSSIEAVMGKATGEVAGRFQTLLKSLEFGANLSEELNNLRIQSRQPALDELVIKLQVSFSFGTPLAEQLAALASSNREFVAQTQFSQAAKRENLMLLPLVFLILPVTVLFAIFPSLQYLNLNN